MVTITSLLLPPQSELASAIKKTLDEEGVAVAAGGGPSLSLAALRLMSGALAQQLTGMLDQIRAGRHPRRRMEQGIRGASAAREERQVPGQGAVSAIGGTQDHLRAQAVRRAHEGRTRARTGAVQRLSRVHAPGRGVAAARREDREIQTGKVVKGKGTLKCGPLLLVEKEIQPVQIPGTIPVPPSKADSTEDTDERQAS